MIAEAIITDIKRTEGLSQARVYQLFPFFDDMLCVDKARIWNKTCWMCNLV